jgi:hypothetical protein
MSNTENTICAPKTAFGDSINLATGSTSFTIDIGETDLWETSAPDSTCIDPETYFYA